MKSLAKFFEIIIFTASHQSYADPIIDFIDSDNVISHRFYRQHCVKIGNFLIKNLDTLNRSLKSTLIIDNSIISFSLQIDNGIPILPFTGKKDKEIISLKNFILGLSFDNDVRHQVRSFFQWEKFARLRKNPQKLLQELYFN